MTGMGSDDTIKVGEQLNITVQDAGDGNLPHFRHAVRKPSPRNKTDRDRRSRISRPHGAAGEAWRTGNSHDGERFGRSHRFKRSQTRLGDAEIEMEGDHPSISPRCGAARRSGWRRRRRSDCGRLVSRRRRGDWSFSAFPALQRRAKRADGGLVQAGFQLLEGGGFFFGRSGRDGDFIADHRGGGVGGEIGVDQRRRAGRLTCRTVSSQIGPRAVFVSVECFWRPWNSLSDSIVAKRGLEGSFQNWREGKSAIYENFPCPRAMGG